MLRRLVVPAVALAAPLALQGCLAAAAAGAAIDLTADVAQGAAKATGAVVKETADAVLPGDDADGRARELKKAEERARKRDRERKKADD